MNAAWLLVAALAAAVPTAVVPTAVAQDAPPKKDEKPADKPADKKDGKDDKKDAKKVVDGVWGNNYEAALAEAKRTKKYIVANFDADWQENCRKQKLEVFTKPDFLDWAKRFVILLEVEFPGTKPLPDELKKQNDALAAKYKVEKYPTTVFINPEGEAVGSLGYTVGGPHPWIKKADKILEDAKKKK